ncbi:sulfurtransferase [Verrucomicrobiales bacterium]|nr:sulfurtransferase [Verrucomicrobiales bacterium]
MSNDSKISAYAHPEKLVSTEWLAANLDAPNTRIVESNEDILLYDTGHIPGAVHIDWIADLNDKTVRDYVSPEAFAALCEKNGITPDTTVIFYGDKSNWWSAYALWVFELFGHTNSKLVDGGSAKWKAEGREVTREKPSIAKTTYPVPAKRDDARIRAFYHETLAHAEAKKPMVDVRSPGEFSGAVTHMPEYPQEGVLRGGHIPGAKSCPWSTAANPDATFKTVEELRKIYTEDLALGDADDIVAYCRIGERSSHTWFVLTYLLGYKNVRNYDGSWTEWGNMVRSPIEKDV